MIEFSSDAEILIDIATSVLFPRSELVVLNGDEPLCTVEVVNLAVRLYRQPSSFKLRAMVERWTREQIVREIW